MKYFFLLFTSIILLSISISRAKNPVEVGHVNWMRDHDAALKTAQETGKPLFVLFQEVPGCAGCQSFGKNVLTHPDLVKNIESEFVPLLIHNNKGGKDAKLLKKYGEPAWNYQVIRFLNSKGQDIIPRKDRVWDLKGVSNRMATVLEKVGKTVPKSLLLLTSKKIVPDSAKAASGTKPKLQQAAVAQYCFWTGERVIGGIEGVHETEAGFLNGHEVTLVKYDPEVVSLKKITQIAQKAKTADKIYTSTKGYKKARQSDQKKQIQGTAFAKLALTPEQATKVNAFARSNPKKAFSYLSDEQKKELLKK